MKRTALYLESLPLRMLVDFAKRADERGFDTIWKPEIIFSDAFVPSAAFALATKRIRIGSGVVGVFGRSPVVLALTAAALAELSGNRMILGLGTQARPYVEGWHGLEYEKPHTRMREVVEVVKRILRGETVSFEGKTVRLKDFRLGLMGPPPDVRIYVAAIGPQMIEVAGEVADGVLGYFYSVDYVRDVFLPHLERGAKRAGRTLDEIDVEVGFPTLVSEEPEAKQWIKPQVVMFATASGSSRFYQEIVRRAGFGGNFEGILRAVEKRSMEEAVRCVTDEMVDAFTLCGTPDEVAARMDEYRKAGVHVPVMNPVPPRAYYPLFSGHLAGMEFPQPDFEAYVGNVRNIVEKVPL